MLYTNQTSGSTKEHFLKGSTVYAHKGKAWSCVIDQMYKCSFPICLKATYKI